MEREEYTKHVTTSHVPQTDFKETAVFVGQTNTTKTDANQLPTARDRTGSDIQSGRQGFSAHTAAL